MRLNQDRQMKLEPKRMAKAKKEIEKLGYKVIQLNDTKIQFEHYQGNLINYFPYSGWASGSTIQDGRGLRKLLNQIKT